MTRTSTELSAHVSDAARVSVEHGLVFGDFYTFTAAWTSDAGALLHQFRVYFESREGYAKFLHAVEHGRVPDDVPVEGVVS